MKTDSKNKTSKINLDLQYKEAHRKFLEKLTDGKTVYQRLPDVTSIEVLLSDKPNDPHNAKLVKVIKDQFPATVNRITFKSLAKKAESLKPYIDALNFAKTNVATEFCSKNLAVDGDTFNTVLQTCNNTKRIVFFGTTFSNLNKTSVNATSKYSIQELSFSYCKGLNEKTAGVPHVIAALGKNPDLVSSLRSVELAHNKLESESDVKTALTAAKLSKVNLVYKEASKKTKGAKGKAVADSASADSDEESGDDEEADSDEDEDEDEDENEEDSDEELDSDEE
jgi:ribosomal protein L12E/L44/L45/RPP1/RPP2